jgi:hypothetical protein
MSDGESTLADQQGKFTQVVKDGEKVPDVEWIPGRILLSDKRIVLASNQGKRTIPLSKVQTIKTRDDARHPFANLASYLSPVLYSHFPAHDTKAILGCRRGNRVVGDSRVARALAPRGV